MASPSISERSFARQFETTGEITTMDQYGADCYNDTPYELLRFLAWFFTGGCVWLRDSNFSENQKQLDQVNDAMYSELFNNNRDGGLRSDQLKISVKLENNINVVILLQEKSGGGVEVDFNGKKVTLGDMSFSKMEEFMLTHRRTRLGDLDSDPKKVIRQLLYQNTLRPIRFNVNGHDDIMPTIEKHPCPGEYPFVEISAGTTFHGPINDIHKNFSGSATVAFVEDKIFTTTVVGGGEGLCSALITTAALQTVHACICHVEDNDKDINAFSASGTFYKNLKKILNICGFDANKFSTPFIGAVLFRIEGKPMRFMYSGGGNNMALMSFSKDGKVIDYYLQKELKCVATIDDAANVARFALMTGGCVSAYLEPDLQTGKNELLSFKQNLPKHGEFDFSHLLSSVKGPKLHLSLDVEQIFSESNRHLLAKQSKRESVCIYDYPTKKRP
jgi:hypothetical protein